MIPDLPPELRDTLRRYLILQEEEQRRREEKRTLQAQIARYMAAQGLNLCQPEVDGRLLKVRYQSVTRIEYDEPLLRQRLGSRYSEILAPDWRKVRAKLPALAPALEPHLDLIGSPQPDRVRCAIEHNHATLADFEGAFRRIVTDRVAVIPVRLPGERAQGEVDPERPAEA